MKKYLATLPALFFITFAYADPYAGKVMISGSIEDNTCTVSTDTTNLQVTLGDISSKQFQLAGSTSQAVAFTVDLQNCGAAASSVETTFSGAADEQNPALLKLDAQPGSASGIGVAILDADRTLIPLNNASKAYPLDVSKSDNPLQFYAQYAATGSAVTAGVADATATFSLTYQ